MEADPVGAAGRLPSGFFLEGDSGGASPSLHVVCINGFYSCSVAPCWRLKNTALLFSGGEN